MIDPHPRGLDWVAAFWYAGLSLAWFSVGLLAVGAWEFVGWWKHDRRKR